MSNISEAGLDFSAQGFGFVEACLLSVPSLWLKPSWRYRQLWMIVVVYDFSEFQDFIALPCSPHMILFSILPNPIPAVTISPESFKPNMAPKLTAPLIPRTTTKVCSSPAASGRPAHSGGFSLGLITVITIYCIPNPTPTMKSPHVSKPVFWMDFRSPGSSWLWTLREPFKGTLQGTPKILF